jgi:hypothetical protein
LIALEFSNPLAQVGGFFCFEQQRNQATKAGKNFVPWFLCCSILP